MEEELTHEEEHKTEPETIPTRELGVVELSGGEVPILMDPDAEMQGMDDGETSRPEGSGESRALKMSIGLGLPADRYRVVLPKGSFPPLTGRQQFIARLREKDRVSFRVFQGDEELASQNEFLAEVGMVGIALNNEDKAFLEIDLNLNLDNILRVRLFDKFGQKEAFVVLDMAKGPKAGLKQDSLSLIMEKLGAIEERLDDIASKR